MTATLPTSLKLIATVDGEELLFGDPGDGQKEGLFVQDFSDFGPYYRRIPVSHDAENERWWLRELRLQAARIAGPDVDEAQALYRFLKDDAA